MLFISRSLCSLYFTHSFLLPMSLKSFQSISTWVFVLILSWTLIHFSICNVSHPTGSQWPTQVFPTSPDYGNCWPSLLCSNPLLSEKTGFHSLSFCSVFALKQCKSASLDSIVLRHWCQNLNFLLEPSHRMYHRLVKLNASEVKLLSPTFKPSVPIAFFASLFIYACLGQPTFEMS